jgi:hypothetical protein
VISVLLRLIPYLYSFIKEMNRKDMEKGTTQKQKARYRTVIAILLSLFLAYGIISGYYFHREMKKVDSLEEQLAKEKERGYVDMTKFVPRSDHEQVVSLLAHKMNRASFLDELALDEIKSICESDPSVCGNGTKRTISMLEDFLEVRKTEKDNLDKIESSLEKEKAEMRAQADKK